MIYKIEKFALKKKFSKNFYNFTKKTKKLYHKTNQTLRKV